MCKAAHEFRGEFIDSCARVEHWMCDVLKRAYPDRAPKSATYLFGQKLKSVVELVDQQPDLFAKPSSVKSLLDRFQPFAALRSELAHAVLIVPADDEIRFLFHGAGGPELKDIWRFWITPPEAKAIASELKQLARLVCDQKLKP